FGSHVMKSFFAPRQDVVRSVAGVSRTGDGFFAVWRRRHEVLTAVRRQAGDGLMTAPCPRPPTRTPRTRWARGAPQSLLSRLLFRTGHRRQVRGSLTLGGQ